MANKMLLYDIQERRFLASFFLLVPRIIPYKFYTMFTEKLELVFHCIFSWLGVSGEASQRAYKSSPPTAGAQEATQEGLCGKAFCFGLFFVRAKRSLGSVTSNEKASHGAVKISAIS